MSDVVDGRRAWATNAFVDIDIRSLLVSSFFLVVGQNGGVGGFAGFHGCVSEFFCPRCVAPIDCGPTPGFILLYESQEASSSVVCLPVIVDQLVCPAVVSAFQDRGLSVPLLSLMMLNPHLVFGSEVREICGLGVYLVVCVR